MSSTLEDYYQRAKSRWFQDGPAYLPISATMSNSSSRNSSSSITLKDESSTSRRNPSLSSLWSNASTTPNGSIHQTKSITQPNWQQSRRKYLLIALHMASLIFGAIGIGAIIYYKIHHYMPAPVYSQYDISQAGYIRPAISPPTSSNHVGDDRKAGQSHRPLQTNTTFVTWTFPSSSSLSSEVSSENTSSTAATTTTPFTSDDQHLLILSPIRNAQGLLPTYFKHLENLAHPKANTSLGFLLSDEEDDTGSLVSQWCGEQASRGEYRSITLLRKDFGLISPKGEARHANWIQSQRRGLMARARTLLLTSTINPTHDWVLWLDVDVQEMPSNIISDLMQLGRVPAVEDQNRQHNNNQENVHDENDNNSPSVTPPPWNSRTVLADIIVPNVAFRRNGFVRGYDLNNWAETPKSEELKATLDEDVILHEGDSGRDTYRHHLTDEWVRPNVTLDPFLPNLSMLSRSQPATGSESSKISNLYDPSSPAYIGRQVPLDAVGGVATLVRASVHLFGGVFPSWNVDHEVETEGFGVLANKLGARIVGLPNYLVLHK